MNSRLPIFLFFILFFQKGGSTLPDFDKPQHAKSLIIIDPGHGGPDEGAKMKTIMEKKLALQTSFFVRRYLYELGYRVIMTRSKDSFIPLARRVSIANNTHAALFVSVHYNSSPSPEAYGVEIFYCHSGNSKRVQESKKLAALTLKQLTFQTNAFSRGVKSGNFYVIRESSVPAILVEGGFITNDQERSNLKDLKYLEKIGKGIALGIDTYLRSCSSTT